ncbi:hypothetical protein NC651_019347 [Populus alba x Populus x berolinensis]|nr:hypothetical protein NC651_019322 [Populus alba x Populus x berolinensis]KAJ6901547.1 hypothetical protein NC651_019347 [Populus alba x Populus x berolinensis]
MVRADLTSKNLRPTFGNSQEKATAERKADFSTLKLLNFEYLKFFPKPSNNPRNENDRLVMDIIVMNKGFGVGKITRDNIGTNSTTPLSLPLPDFGGTQMNESSVKGRGVTNL